jgi:hypothetical protein
MSEPIKLKWDLYANPERQLKSIDRKIKYLNYRCRRCGTIISYKTKSGVYDSGIPTKDFNRTLQKQQSHICTAEKGEVPFFDLISYSEEPLKAATFTISEE